MSKYFKNYGTRTCLVCKKEFEAVRPAQITCSEECRISRRKKLQNEARLERAHLPWETVEWLNCQFESMISAQRKNKEAESRPVKAAEPVVKKEPEKKATKKTAPEKYRNICATCGSTFKSANKDTRYCCDQCAEESAVIGM